MANPAFERAVQPEITMSAMTELLKRVVIEPERTARQSGSSFSHIHAIDALIATSMGNDRRVLEDARLLLAKMGAFTEDGRVPDRTLQLHIQSQCHAIRDHDGALTHRTFAWLTP
jgi:hypothetical protein